MNQDPFITHLIDKHQQSAFMDSCGSGAIFGPIVACAVMKKRQLKVSRSITFETQM